MSNFGRNIPVFAKSFRVLAVDSPASASPTNPSSTSSTSPSRAEALLELLDSLGIEKAHILGNSLGGGTAVRFALDNPKRAGRLVLMGPGGLSLNVFSRRPDRGRAQAQRVRRADPDRAEKIEEFLRIMVFDQSLVTDELIDERFEAAAATRSRCAPWPPGQVVRRRRLRAGHALA